MDLVRSRPLQSRFRSTLLKAAPLQFGEIGLRSLPVDDRFSSPIFFGLRAQGRLLGGRPSEVHHKLLFPLLHAFQHDTTFIRYSSGA